jgi:hypothetical protein
MPHAHITKIEDARTGQWLRHLDPITDPIKRIDMGWTMGDWNQLDVTTETVGLRESSSFFLPSPFFTFLLFLPYSSSCHIPFSSLGTKYPFPPTHRVYSGPTRSGLDITIPIPIPLVSLAGQALIPDWLKWDSWVREQRNRLLSIWENSTREWAYDQGISPRLSIAKGKIVPEGAKEEHQRQKALGWDVSGNLGKE